MALARHEYNTLQFRLAQVPASELTQALARIDQANQRYVEALIVLGERVAGLVDLDPSAS